MWWQKLLIEGKGKVRQQVIGMKPKAQKSFIWIRYAKGQISGSKKDIFQIKDAQNFNKQQ